jgi:protein-S-isoprenylcysteine O-methyltransferase Ste14
VKSTAEFVLICWVIVASFWAVSAFCVKETKEWQPLPGRLVYLLLTVLAAMLFKGAVGGVQFNRSVLPYTPVLGIVADLIVLLGLFISIWARAVLGRNWSGRVTLKEEHELILRGPYRVVRHPIYSWLLLMIFGTAILVGRISGIFALLVSVCGLWLKLRQAETLMTKHFPQILNISPAPSP